MSKPLGLCKGFTLLELLVALAIFAIAALTGLKHANQLTLQYSTLEDKTLALWLAENRIAEMRLTQPWPPLGSSIQQITSAQREWSLATEVTPTALPTLRKIVVKVNKTGDPDSLLISLAGYTGEH